MNGNSNSGSLDIYKNWTEREREKKTDFLREFINIYRHYPPQNKKISFIIILRWIRCSCHAITEPSASLVINPMENVMQRFRITWPRFPGSGSPFWYTAKGNINLSGWDQSMIIRLLRRKIQLGRCRKCRTHLSFYVPFTLSRKM